MTSHVLFRAIVLVIILVSFAGAQVQTRDEVREAEVVARLQKVSPNSVETFRQATAAADAQNFEEAEKLFGEVLKNAPDFDPALRRRGFALITLGRRDEGLALVKKALALNRDAANLTSAAMAIAESQPEGKDPSETDMRQALAYAKEASRLDKSHDSDPLVLTAQLALSLDDMESFNAALERLNREFPDLGATHYFNGVKLANEGDFSGGLAEVDKSEKLGIPVESASRMKTAITDARGSQYFGLYDYIWYGFYIAGVWVVGLVGLFVVGKVLSKKTLDSIEASDPNDIRGGEHAGLRSLYRRVISFAGIYYYISQPVVIFLVLIATAGIILFFFWVGTIPIKLVVVIGFVGLASVFYMIKSLLFRAKVEDPGRALSESEAPALWEVVRQVATAVETRPVGEIRVTPGAEVAVYERGSMRDKMNDKAERILIVGLAGVDGLSINAFRAILAHEYGHFSNRDTAGGEIAQRVNHNIMQVARSMGQSGTATFYNIAFQFLRLYHFLFRRITHGASRLQEILADRVAVHQYGAAAFREGLTHIIRREIEFGRILDSEFPAAFNAGRKMNNLYELLPKSESIEPDLESKFDEAINAVTTEDDTHPSPADRFRLADLIKSKEAEAVEGDVWSLIANRDSLTSEINATLEKQLKQYAYEAAAANA